MKSSDKKRFSLRDLFYNDKYVKVLALLFAIVLWGIVVSFINTEAESTIGGIPLTMEENNADLASRGLSVIEMETPYVSVKVQGSRLAIGSLDKNDIVVAVDTSSVKGAGVYQLPLNAYKRVPGNDFEILSGTLNPSTVSIRLDQLLDKKIEIEVELDGVSVADGFIAQEAYSDTEYLTVSGPETDVSGVFRAVLHHEVTSEVNSSMKFNEKIVLYDKDNNVINNEHISMSQETADIVLPVLKTKNVELSFEFVNVPEGLPIQNLNYHLSAQSINIAGPAEKIDAISSINVGYINFKQLTPMSVYAFEIPLSQDLTNLDNITSVTVSFNLNNMETRYYSNIDNFNFVNVPENFNVESTLTAINSVRVVGETETLDALTSDDMIAQIDLSERNLQKGQFSVPVKIIIPDRGLVWAVGDYSTIIAVKEK